MFVAKEDPRWEKLLTEQHDHHFQLTSAAMMFSRCRRQVQIDGSPQNVRKNIDELYAFFEKFESLLKNDLNAIFN